MKIPFVSEKTALIIMIVFVLGMLVFGIARWPEGKSHEELRLENRRKSDSLNQVNEPEVFQK